MSVATEIERIQTAKETLKTKLNAKNDSEHQITNELISDYGNFVDSITGGVDINDYFDLTKKTIGTFNTYIKQIPMIDTSDYTSMNSIFIDYSLTTIPQLNTSNVTDMSYMFNSCQSLMTIPQLDTSKVTNMNSMFYSCRSLMTIPQLDTSKVTNMNRMFYSCYSLTTIPQLDASKVTNIERIFYNCYLLTNLGGFTNLGQAYSTTQSANYGGYTLTLSSSTKITHDSLMNVINNLYDIAAKGVKTQQLVIGSTNLAKLTAEEIQIATDKGFSVS